MIRGAGRTFTWTSFNKPATITEGQGYSEFHYGPDRARYKQIREREEGGQLVSTTIHYVGQLYERHHEGLGFEDRHYIRVDGQAIAVRTTGSDGTAATHYLHRDHLDSITAVTNAAGNVVERYSYDAFGKRREPTWLADGDDSLMYSTMQLLDRGYTGHEHLDHVGLIHMNGRVQDPIIGRFASADPIIARPHTTQGYNRYSYASNSPLSRIDRNGFVDGQTGSATLKPIDVSAPALPPFSPPPTLLTMGQLTQSIGRIGPVSGADLGLEFGTPGMVGGVGPGAGPGMPLRWADRKESGEDDESVVDKGKFSDGERTETFERAEQEASFYNQAFDSAVRGINIAGGAAQIGAGGKFIGAGVALCATGAGCVVGGPSVLLGTGLGLLGMSNIQEGVSGDDGFVRLIAGNLATDTANLFGSGIGLARPVLKLNEFGNPVFKLYNRVSPDFTPYFRKATTKSLILEIGQSSGSLLLRQDDGR